MYWLLTWKSAERAVKQTLVFAQDVACGINPFLRFVPWLLPVKAAGFSFWNSPSSFMSSILAAIFTKIWLLLKTCLSSISMIILYICLVLSCHIVFWCILVLPHCKANYHLTGLRSPFFMDKSPPMTMAAMALVLGIQYHPVPIFWC